MIKKLETAGLGYHVGAVDTYEKIGTIFKNLKDFQKYFTLFLFIDNNYLYFLFYINWKSKISYKECVNLQTVLKKFLMT